MCLRHHQRVMVSLPVFSEAGCCLPLPQRKGCSALSIYECFPEVSQSFSGGTRVSAKRLPLSASWGLYPCSRGRGFFLAAMLWTSSLLCLTSHPGLPFGLLEARSVPHTPSMTVQCPSASTWHKPTFTLNRNSCSPKLRSQCYDSIPLSLYHDWPRM